MSGFIQTLAAHHRRKAVSIGENIGVAYYTKDLYGIGSFGAGSVYITWLLSWYENRRKRIADSLQGANTLYVQSCQYNSYSDGGDSTFLLCGGSETDRDINNVLCVIDLPSMSRYTAIGQFTRLEIPTITWDGYVWLVPNGRQSNWGTGKLRFEVE